MAQRRSRNRRLSARKSNVSGFLNEDTNIYDNSDPLWYDRTAVRPSTSLRMSKNTTAILDPDSTVHTSQLPADWFENLSQSESSKLLQEAVNKKSSQQPEERPDSDYRSAATESESEHEFQKKRANLRSSKKQSNKIDKSNAFMKALEKTTDSHTRNLTHAQMLEGNESESTHDDSRTIRKLRPKFTRRAKNDTNNFDKALESDSASERVETSRRSLRSTSKRVSEITEEFATPEKQKRLTRSTAENIVNASHGKKSVEKVQNKSVNKTKDNEIAESSVRELRNRNIVTSPAKSATPAKSPRQSSGTKKRPAEDQSSDSSPHSPVKRHKRSLFSQGNKSTADKSKGDKSAFDAALDSVIDSQENEGTITETASTSKVNEQNQTPEDDNNNDDDDDSDTSTIPQNIRRTRSRSLFGERKSGENGDVNSSKNKPRAQERDSTKNTSQSSKNRSAANDSIASDRSTLKNLTIAESSDDEEDIYNTSVTRKKASEQVKDRKSESDKSLVSSIETDDEDMVDASPSKTKQSETNKSSSQVSDRQQVSSIETSDDEDIINMSHSRNEQSKDDTSKKLNVSSARADKSRKSKSTSVDDKDQDAPSSLDLSTRKSRSRLFQKKNTSTNENAFDQISFNNSTSVRAKSKENEIEETPRLSQQRSPKAPNKSQKNQSTNVSKNKSSSRENTKNNSKADESEDETSTIPHHIRRTRSRLFKSRTDGDDNAFEDALDVENVPENRPELSQKSTMSNKSTNKSYSVIRDAGANKSALDAAKKKPKIILDKIIRPAESADVSSGSPTKAQESRCLSPRKSTPDTSLNKKKSASNSQDTTTSSHRNSQDAASDQRSVETSSDGTLAPRSPKEASTPFAAPSALPNKASKRVSTMPGSAKSVQNSSYDDLLHTPNPAQSTLNPHGKPVNRITQFSFRTFADLEERTPPTDADKTSKTRPAAAETSKTRPATAETSKTRPAAAETSKTRPAAAETSKTRPTAAETSKTRPNTVLETDDDDDDGGSVDVDVVHDSEVSNCPLLSRHADDIPSDKENSQVQEEVSGPSKSPKKKKQVVRKSNEDQNKEHPIDWEKAKQHTDAVKMMVEAQMRLAEEARKKRELEKQRIDMKLKRLHAQKEAELKRKNKKPIDKAFLVDGKVYKQPKLPRPKQWATNRLYNYLWKKMEPKYGIRTRLKSEEFVVQLSDFATRITKRKKFENYKDQLDEIMLIMAKLGIIKTRFDFHRFVADFLPFSFREKVNPMALPGNERNIPYDPETLYKPLLNNSRNTEETSDADDS